MSKLRNHKKSRVRLEERLHDWENKLIKGGKSPQGFNKPGSQKK